MVVGILAALLSGVTVALLVYGLYNLVVSYAASVTEERLRRLLPDIESTKDRDSIRRLTQAGPWVTVILLLVLLFFARSALAVIVTIVAAYFSYRLPVIIQQKVRALQDEKILEQLPEALDSIANSVKAGESLPVGFKVVSEKYDPPIGALFRTITRRYEDGQLFEDALMEIADAIDIEAFHYVARAVAIQVKRGGPSYEMLREIRNSIVEQDRCDRMMKAATAAGRFTIKFLTYSPVFLLPVLTFLQPDWASILLGGIGGVMILLTSVGIYLFALRWARSILEVEKV